MPEATIIAFGNLKGGVTKTTTTVNTAIELFLLGKRVLLVDTDGQGNATSALGYEAGKLQHTTYTLMTRASTFDETIKQTYFDKSSGRFFDPTDQGTLPKQRVKSDNIMQGPDLLPCNIGAMQAENELIKRPDWGSLLKNVLTPIRSRYDYILLDTNPSLGKMTVNAFIVANTVVIPTVPEPWPTDGIIILCSAIMEARGINPDLEAAGILFTRVRYTEHGKLMEYIQKDLVPKINKIHPDLHLSCFQSYINESAAFVKATSRRTTIILSHPTDAVSLSYWGFLAELLQKLESPDFPLAYQQYQQTLAIYKNEKEKSSVLSTTKGE